MNPTVNNVGTKKHFLSKILNIKPLCESSIYLTVWSILTAIIYLIIDIIIEKKIKSIAYKLYKSNPHFNEKYDFNLFLEHIYSIMGYNKSFKYIKFALEMLLLPFGIYLYNYACSSNIEYINYIILVLYLLIFISKMSILFDTDTRVNNEVSKSYI